MEYPDRPILMCSVDADGMQMQEGANNPRSSDILVPTTAAAAAAGQAMRAEDLDTPDAIEDEDGSLSAPVVYASLVLGMITVFKNASEEHLSFEGRIKRGGVLAGGDGGVGPGPSVLDDVTSASDGESTAVASSAVWDERVSGELG